MIRVDDRTEDEKRTHPLLVVATDRFMSGWGEARDGLSYAAWACRSEDEYRVERWVRARIEMSRVRIVMAKGYRPGRYCAHLHIYVVNENHPAVRLFTPAQESA